MKTDRQNDATAGPEQPWLGNPDLEDRLRSAGWRYAVLIGIVDCAHAGVDEKIVATDKVRYSHMIKSTHEGGRDVPLWNVSDSIAFVSEISGCSPSVGEKWLQFDWAINRADPPVLAGGGWRWRLIT